MTHRTAGFLSAGGTHALSSSDQPTPAPGKSLDQQPGQGEVASDRIHPIDSTEATKQSAYRDHVPRFLFGIAAALVSAHAAASGYFVYSNSSAEIYDASSGVAIQPWPTFVTEGYQANTSIFNTTASTVNVGGRFKGKSANSDSACDLSTGTLRASGFVSNDVSTPAAYVNGYGTVTFGDSFSIVAPSGPFIWGPSDRATFTLRLTGAVQLTNEDTFPWAVQLYVYKPGSIAMPLS